MPSKILLKHYLIVLRKIMIKKSNIIYTYPNTSTIPQRGGLESRYKKLKEINEFLNSSILQMVEIPADFIKNKTEETKTGLQVCSFLNEDTVKEIYTNDKQLNEINYILHTEPVFSRNGMYGSCTPKLRCIIIVG